MFIPEFSNPNGEGGGSMPTVEALDPFLAKQPSSVGLCSSPFPNKHQISSI